MAAGSFGTIKITVTVTITSQFRMLIFRYVISYMNCEVMVTVTVI